MKTIKTTILLLLLTCILNAQTRINGSGINLTINVNPTSIVIGALNGVVSGNSTIASFLSQTPVADLMFTAQDIARSYGYNSIAQSGGTIGSQRQFRWEPLTDKKQYKWVIIQIGINDINPSSTVAVIMARYQRYIDTIRTNVPSIKIITSVMIPWRGRLETLWPGQELAAYQQWLDLNTAMMGSGPSALTGINGTNDYHNSFLNDGNGYLLPEYAASDGYHENNAARQIIATGFRNALRKFFKN